MDILDGLNPQQREAVLTTEGPLLVLAGAGSGKTTVLTRRIAYILQQGLAKPWQILAITFTNKAAAEMLSRISSLVPGNASDMWIKTFHSACLRILRFDIDKLNSKYTSTFNIYDTTDQKKLIKDCIKDLNLSEDLYPHKKVLSRISDCKNKGITPAEFEKEAYDIKTKNIARIYEHYMIRLEENNALDFDDLLLKTTELFEKCPDVLEYYRNKFKYILVDEYQDTNNVQYRLVSLLAGKYRNLCVVGDDDQSIYRFRGADITNILDFEKQFGEAKTIKLEQNYRSTQTILDAANNVIRNNRGRKNKKLWTDSGSGDKITLAVLNDQMSEASYINNCIETMVKSGQYSYSDFAVLYRTNAQTRSLEESFTCPYRVLAGLRFYDRREIKDLLAYLRLLYNPEDDVNLMRIINVPKRGIGDSTVAKIRALSGSLGKSMYSIISNPEYDEYIGRSSGKIREFVNMIESISQKKNSETVVQIIDDILNKTGYIAAVTAEAPDQAQGRIENIEELRSKAFEYYDNTEEPTFEGFLDNISLVSDVDNLDNEQDAVVLMTFHSAKGLEFPVVFMCGMEKGLFPSFMSETEDGGMEEERRLCYVGITRARQKLIITAVKYRTLYGSTTMQLLSPFVNEIPDELFEDPGQKEAFVAKSYTSSERGGSYGGYYTPTYTSAYKSAPEGTPSKPDASSVRGVMDKYSMFTASKIKKSPDAFGMKKGDRVNHKKFGDGMIISVTPSSGDYLVEILFDRAGTRNLMASIANLKKI